MKQKENQIWLIYDNYVDLLFELHVFWWGKLSYIIKVNKTIFMYKRFFLYFFLRFAKNFKRVDIARVFPLYLWRNCLRKINQKQNNVHIVVTSITTLLRCLIRWHSPKELIFTPCQQLIHGRHYNNASITYLHGYFLHT